MKKKRKEKTDRAVQAVIERKRKYMCSRCNSRYEAEDKYDLVARVAYVDFGIDIEQYQEDEIQVNVIQECPACHELQDETGFEIHDQEKE